MPGLTIEFDAECSQCGQSLDVSVTQNARGNKLEIAPCEVCVKDASDAAYERGLDEGRTEE